jgi:hypothetical protein
MFSPAEKRADELFEIIQNLDDAAAVRLAFDVEPLNEPELNDEVVREILKEKKALQAERKKEMERQRLQKKLRQKQQRPMPAGTKTEEQQQNAQ